MKPPNRNRPPVGSVKAIPEYKNACSFQGITNSQGAAIAESLQLKPSGKASWQGYCPACGYADAFSLSVSDGRLLWHCHACGDQEAVQHSLKGLGLLGGGERGFHVPAPVFSRPKPAKKPDAGQLAYIRKLWAETQPISGVAAAYLSGRGLAGPYPASLRYAPALFHVPTTCNCPAIVGAVTRWPSSDVVAIHRTYLQPGGARKLDDPQAKMMLGQIGGGAVRLAEAGSKLALAEGIETALSVQQVTGIPTWACLSTGGLQAVVLPDSVREVVICADHDSNGAGQRAAIAAAERLSRLGHRVKIATPPQPDTDFNDLLKGAGHD